MTKHTIECPKCHEVFQVDEAGYAAIVKQIRDKEFSKELKERETQFEKDKESALQVVKLEAEKIFQDKLSEKEKEIAELLSKLETEKLSKTSAVQATEAEKDKEIAENDTIRVRKLGKAKIEKILGRSRKDKYILEISKLGK